MQQKNFQPVHQVYDGLFNSYSGHIINLHHPEKSTIEILDIAEALSRICRFGGHCRAFYSVAQHSVFVAALCPVHLKKAALLHDAAEAYLGDVIKPLKVILGDTYGKLEEKFETEIFLRFGISHQDAQAVKEFDRMALEIESEALQKGRYELLTHWMKQYNLIVDNRFTWSPAIGAKMFLDWHKKLFYNQE
jgi:hypothetical protein